MKTFSVKAYIKYQVGKGGSDFFQVKANSKRSAEKQIRDMAKRDGWNDVPTGTVLCIEAVEI